MPQESNNSHPNNSSALKNSSERFRKFVKLTNNSKKTKKTTPASVHCLFKGFVLRVKRLVNPNMKLESLTKGNGQFHRSHDRAP
ncbi:hypothetical protein CEXT_474531 [Caerostris extrusa]|uniref:Uncharacterized protein n=1 Tax=Caerostris extrusa TaxID=172846 RepID=A0AAV4VPF3_CAEEX|nr:hypothetical protein CEXT_474531 [Caerostris extrusa]